MHLNPTINVGCDIFIWKVATLGFQFQRFKGTKLVVCGTWWMLLLSALLLLSCKYLQGTRDRRTTVYLLRAWGLIGSQANPYTSRFPICLRTRLRNTRLTGEITQTFWIASKHHTPPHGKGGVDNQRYTCHHHASHSRLAQIWLNVQAAWVLDDEVRLMNDHS